MDLNRKTLAAALVLIGGGLLIYAAAAYVAAAVDPLAGFALAGAVLVIAGLFGVDV